MQIIFIAIFFILWCMCVQRNTYRDSLSSGGSISTRVTLGKKKGKNVYFSLMRFVKSLESVSKDVVFYPYRRSGSASRSGVTRLTTGSRGALASTSTLRSGISLFKEGKKWHEDMRWCPTWSSDQKKKVQIKKHNVMKDWKWKPCFYTSYILVLWQYLGGKNDQTWSLLSINLQLLWPSLTPVLCDLPWGQNCGSYAVQNIQLSLACIFSFLKSTKEKRKRREALFEKGMILKVVVP